MKSRASFVVSLVVLLLPGSVFAQSDPGIRTGAPAAGGPLGSVAADNPTTILAFFNDGKDRFEEVDSVSATIPGEDGFGLGPRYNSRSCAACHAFPATGGTSPAINPQITDATADGAVNVIPPFILLSGPVREARFIFFTDPLGNPIPSAPNGNVEALYTIAGRSDAGGCTAATIAQPDFTSAISHNNVIFRIPTPVFGAGLMENIDETTLLNYQAAASSNPFGIAGTFNRNGNDGTIARFGWKAQNKSLELFSGEAYNVEMGVSNEIFQNERPSPEEDRASGLANPCKINPTPEDHTNFNTTAIGTVSDAVQFAMFMRLLAPPARNKNEPGGASSINKGFELFEEIGCSVCHQINLGPDPMASRITPDLSNPAPNMFSDLEIHHMGTGLADNIAQGDAGGDQFRTAPLWGLGQRIFLLHDGRTSNLISAIQAHQSTGSEANAVKLNYDSLSAIDQQHILNFLRSL